MYMCSLKFYLEMNMPIYNGFYRNSAKTSAVLQTWFPWLGGESIHHLNNMLLIFPLKYFKVT